MIGNKIFNVVAFDDECDGDGYRQYGITLEEAISFVGNEGYVETSCENTTIFEDGEWVIPKEEAESAAKKEWQKYIDVNPECPEARLGVGL